MGYLATMMQGRSALWIPAIQKPTQNFSLGREGLALRLYIKFLFEL
jgi:hypothetical protein